MLHRRVSQKLVMSRAIKSLARVVVSTLGLILSFCLPVASIWADEPFFRADLIFPLDKWHNHGSSIVELPSGELLVAWYRGSGEHDANDVKIMGARKARGGSSWSEPFVMADTPNFPDGNPVVFIDGKSSLQLISSVILGNDWRTSFLTTHVSADYQQRQQAPIWNTSAPLFLDLKEFTKNLQRNVEEFIHNNQTYPQKELLALRKKSVGDLFLHRLGWIARSRPLELPTGRILLPLYSAELSLSMMAISDDGGRNWSSSKPMVGLGNIQPTVVNRKDGTLVAYMRNAGPPPRRLYASASRDNGVTWSAATHTYLPNPGSAAEIIRLANGYWALAYNDTESGRHSLAISVSDDEGKSWRWTRHLEQDLRPRDKAGQFHYPSIVQGRDGMIHVTFSYFLHHLPLNSPNTSIKHAVFNLQWVQAEAAGLVKKMQ
jgi:predicted neuraminidase